MCYERKRLLTLGMIVLVVAVVTAPSISDAQRKSAGGVTGGARLRPGTYYSNQRANRNTRHARDYSRDIYRYSRDVKTVDPKVAKAESRELGERIEAAKEELKVVREEAKGDKDILTALDSIEKHLAKAAEHHKQLHAECCKESVDGVFCMECCNEITTALEKALTEHSALMRTLETKARANAKKEAPPKK